MTQKLLLNDELTSIAVLTEIPLEEDSRDTPDNLFPYLEGRLSSLTGFNRLAYAMFNPNSLYLRRNPATNLTLYNIDLPRYGTTPTLEHRMIGTRTHVDASMANPTPIYQAGTQGKGWSGMVWRWTKKTHEPGGVQVEYTSYRDAETQEMDRRFAKGMFW